MIHENSNIILIKGVYIVFISNYSFTLIIPNEFIFGIIMLRGASLPVYFIFCILHLLDLKCRNM